MEVVKLPENERMNLVMKKAMLTIIPVLLISIYPSLGDGAQNFVLFENDTINRIDINSLKQGRWVYFGRDKKMDGYNPEQKVEEGEFSDNRRTGIWISYFPNGKIKSEITYQNNRPNGYAKQYYENGKIREEGDWKGNRYVGQFKLYHENGNVSQDFNFTETGKREGPQKYFHENGKVMIEGDWKDGKESGVLKEYFADGTIKSEKVFDGGSINPEATKVYEKPAEIVKQEKEEAKPVVSKVVVEKEETPNIGLFDGNGNHKLYNKDKQISKEGEFKNYKLINGKWYIYDDNGILIRIEVYKRGRYVGDATIEEDVQ